MSKIKSEEFQNFKEGIIQKFPKYRTIMESEHEGSEWELNWTQHCHACRLRETEWELEDRAEQEGIIYLTEKGVFEWKGLRHSYYFFGVYYQIG